MNDLIFETFLLFFVAHFAISNAKEFYDNDELLVKFLKELPNFERIFDTDELNNEMIKEELTRVYETHLGALQFLREEWHCAQIGEEFEKNEQTECHKYRKYVDILYQYLFYMYVGFPAIKPMFYFDKINAFCSMTETVRVLAIISKFYFNSEFGKRNGHKLETLFVRYFEPKLFNEEKLNYEANMEKQKETFQEITVQMGIELKWEKEINENYVKLSRHKFDGILEEMLKKAKIPLEMASETVPSENNTATSNKFDFLFLYPPFPETFNKLIDAAFIAFVRGQSFFEQICDEMNQDEVLQEIAFFGVDRLEDSKQYLTQKYETFLALLYLMRHNWHCDKMIDKQIKNEDEEEGIECEDFPKYLDYFYEHLFQIYAKSRVPVLAQQFPAVIPLFKYNGLSYEHMSFVDIVYYSNIISWTFFGMEKKKYTYHTNFLLVNENKVGNYKTNFGTLDKTLRQEFDNKLKILLKKVREEEKMNKWNQSSDTYKLRDSPFYDTAKNSEDEAFIAFVKGPFHFENFCIKKKWDLLHICNYKLAETASFEQKKEHLTQKFEAFLGFVYLMRENWHCAKIGEEFGEKEETECQKYRKYLDIFYKYLYDVNAEDDDILKAIDSLLLIQKIELFGNLIDVVKALKRISKFYFNSKFRKTKKYNLQNIFSNFLLMQDFEQIFKAEKENKEEKAEGMRKEQFDEKMKEMLKRTKEKASEEAKELKKMEKQMKKQAPKTTLTKKDQRKKRAEFADKFGILFDSPFYGTIGH